MTPPEFFGERVRRPPDFWVPLSFQPEIEARPSVLNRTDTYWLSPIGRLAPGASRAQAQASATAALQQFVRSKLPAGGGPDREQQIRSTHVELSSGATGISTVRYLYSQPLRILLVVVGLVLLIACANVGQPSIDTRGRTTRRAVDAPRARRRTRAADSSTDHREPAARGARRFRRHPARALGDEGADGLRRLEHVAGSRDAQRPRAALHARGHAGRGDLLRRRAGDSGVADRSRDGHQVAIAARRDQPGADLAVRQRSSRSRSRCRSSCSSARACSVAA